MKKSLIALAVAGAFAAPAFAATGNVDVYGIVNVAIEDTDLVPGTDIQVVDRVSRIGFKGSEDLGGGLKAIWQIESALTGAGLPGTTMANPAGIGGSGIGTRNTFIGLAGDFGTFLMGRHDTPYKLGTGSLDPFADTIADYNGMVDGVADFIDVAQDHRSPQAIAYISPTWSGFHFAVAGVATNAAANFNNNDSIDALSATGVYVNGPLFASLSYQSVDVADSDAWKLGAGYTFGDAKVGLIYENVDYGLGGERDSWIVNGVYNMGPIALKAEYASADMFGSDGDGFALGADYSLSKRTTAYVVYTSFDTDIVGVDGSGWALGMKHSF